MSEREDLDLGRQLDAAFAATRPERGFEDRLWQRLDSRRPWWRRLAAGNPWPLAGGAVAVAVAGLLVVAGHGWAGHGGAAGTGSTTSGAAAPAVERAGAEGAFGRLPRPPGAAAAQTRGPAAPAQPGQAAAGPVAGLPPTLPVFRYDAASAPDAAAFGRSLGAGLSGRLQDGGGSGREPTYSVTAADPGPAAGPAVAADQARLAAEAFLGRIGALPSGPARVYVESPGAGRQVVHFVRLFAVPGLAEAAPQVDSAGRPVGTDVVVGSEGRVLAATGPQAARSDQASYRSAAAPANGVGEGAPARVELVYVAVVDTPLRGYFEPAYLLTGPAGEVLRLAPALDPSQLR